MKEYSNDIDRILHDMYDGALIKENNLTMIPALGYEKEEQPDRIFSILNKVNTNHILRKRLMELSGVGPDTLIDHLREHSEDYFTENGRHFKEIHRVIRAVESKGERLEHLASGHIKEIFEKKFRHTPHIRHETTGSYRDMILGIDLSMDFMDKEVTFQVKPLLAVIYGTDTDTLTTKGQVKSYRTHYMVFASEKNGNVRMYRNKPDKIDRTLKTYVFKKQHYIG